MQSASQTVKRCAITLTTSTPLTNSGNGILVVTEKRGDGLTNENIFGETGILKCVKDGHHEGTRYAETFTYFGDEAQSSPLHWDWPKGSGALTSLGVVNPASSNDLGNLLTNSDFEAWTSNVPDSWLLTVGTAGTDLLQSTAQKYRGSSSVQMAGGATLTALTQEFEASGGTLGVLKPLTPYAVNLWGKVDVVPAAGTLVVELIDSANNVVNDAQGNANAFSISLPGLSTSWAAKNEVFFTPKTLSAGYKLRLRLSTALSSGSNLFLDFLGLTEMTELYPGGVFAALFTGSQWYVLGDSYTIQQTNDRGGASNLNTFQTLFDRLFKMRDKRLLLPSAASPTIADTLITA